jgi:hypothetical protein
MTIAEQATFFQNTFMGRRDAFGENRRCQKYPLTDAIFRAHIQGHRRIGVYLLDPKQGNGSQVGFAAVDVDDDVNGLQKAVEIQRGFQSLGFDAPIEASRSDNSFHIWIFFSEWVHAEDVRTMANYVLKRCELGGLEVFPKQTRLYQSKPYGNFIYLPLHRKLCQDNRTVFIDDNGKPIADQWGFLADVIRHTSTELSSVVERIPKAETKRGRKQTPTNAQQTINPKEIGGLSKNFQVLLSCDPLIRSLWNRQQTERSDLDWALGRACIERGILGREDLTAILAHFPQGKFRRDGRLDYLALTVGKLMDAAPIRVSENATDVSKILSEKISFALANLQESQAIVFRASPGLGKTLSARNALQAWDGDAIMAMQTGDRSEEEFVKFQLKASLLKGRNAENCMSIQRVQAVASRGYSPGKVVCPACPHNPVRAANCCEYYRQFQDLSRIVVCSWEQAIELHEAGKLQADVMIFDEDPTRAFFRKHQLYTQHFKISSNAPRIIQAFGKVIQTAFQMAQDSELTTYRGKELIQLLVDAVQDAKGYVQAEFFDTEPFQLEMEDLPRVVKAIDDTFNQVGKLFDTDSQKAEDLPHALLVDVALAIQSDYEKTQIRDDFNSSLALIADSEPYFVLRKIREMQQSTPMILLDAYARKPYYERLLGRNIELINVSAKPNCTVYQIPLNTSKNAFSKRGPALIQVLKNLLRKFTQSQTVIYTHMERKASVKEAIKALGLDIALEHFFSGRGTNDYEDFQTVIIFGTPEANPGELLDETRALYADDPKLISDEPDPKNRRNYADPRLQELREMKRKDEILQIAHRSRPVHAKQKSDKHIVIVSQIYLEELPPDHIIDPKSLIGISRKDALAEIIRIIINKLGFWTDTAFEALSFNRDHKGDAEALRRMNEEQAMTSEYGVSYKNTLIREGVLASVDAGLIHSSQYGRKNEFIADRDSILADLGFERQKVSVQIEGHWRTFHVWGDTERAKAFLAPAPIVSKSEALSSEPEEWMVLRAEIHDLETELGFHHSDFQELRNLIERKERLTASTTTRCGHE